MAEKHEMVPLNPNQHLTSGLTPVRDFYTEAKENNWEGAIRIIQRKGLQLTGILHRRDEHSEQNILHLASQIANNEDAFKYTEYILKGRRVEDKHHLIECVNRTDKNKQTPLHIAIKSRNDRLVELLLRNGADTGLPMECDRKEKIVSVLYSTFPEIMIQLFNENLHIISDRNSYRQEKDQVQYNLTPIVGARAKKQNSLEEYNMDNLAVVLRQSRKTKSKILLHPLVQLFLYAKHEEYKFWIYFSAFFHVLWNIMSFVFIFSNARIAEHSNKTMTGDNISSVMRTDSAEPNFGSWYFVVMYVILLIFTIKEAIEYGICPDKGFYLRQNENKGQWAIIIFDLLVLLSAILMYSTKIFEKFVLGKFKLQQIMSLVYFIGTPLSVLLIQGQIYKFQRTGIYIEMFRQCFKNILILIIIFSPVLASFIAFFHALLPQDSKFSASYGYGVNKLLVMMIGDFDYEKMFENTYGVPFVIAQIIFFVFVISISVLLQNLLIGLAVSDVQKLRKRAKGKYLETLLENIYLHEHFWKRMWSCLGRKNKSEPNETKKVSFNKLPADLQKVLVKWQQSQKSTKKRCKSCGGTGLLDSI